MMINSVIKKKKFFETLAGKKIRSFIIGICLILLGILFYVLPKATDFRIRNVYGENPFGLSFLLFFAGIVVLFFSIIKLFIKKK